MKTTRSILLLTAVIFLLGCPVLAAQDKPAAEGVDTTIPEATGTFTLYASQMPKDAAKLKEWQASGKVLKAGWQGKLGKDQHLAFVGSEATGDKDLAGLKGLTALQSLNLSWCRQITDAGLAHLKGLTALQSLDLGGCGITDAGLAHLKGLTGVQSLYLRECQITDAGLAHLKDLIALQSLDLGYCEQITDAGLAHLKGLTALQSLDLTEGAIGPRTPGWNT